MAAGEERKIMEKSGLALSIEGLALSIEGLALSIEGLALRRSRRVLSWAPLVNNVLCCIIYLMRFQFSEKRLVFFAKEIPNENRRVDETRKSEMPDEARGLPPKLAVSTEQGSTIASSRHAFRRALEFLKISGSNLFRQSTAGGQNKAEKIVHHPNLYLIPYDHYLLKRKNLLRDLGIHVWDSVAICRDKLLNDLRKMPRIQAHKSEGLVYLLNGYTRYFYAKELGIPDDMIPVTTPDGAMMLAEYLRTPEK